MIFLIFLLISLEFGGGEETLRGGGVNLIRWLGWYSGYYLEDGGAWVGSNILYVVLL